MHRLPALREIVEAPTYADALEQSGKVNIKYRTPETEMKSFFTHVVAPWCLLVMVFVFLPILVPGIWPYIKTTYYGYPSTQARLSRTPVFLQSLTFWSLAAGVFLLWVARRPSHVRIENSRLVQSGLALPVGSIDLVDIRWVGIYGFRFHVFAKNGKRLILPIADSTADEKRQGAAMRILATLSAMFARQEAGHILESGTKITVPLSQGATIRRFPRLLAGAFLLTPLVIILVLACLTIGSVEVVYKFNHYCGLLLIAFFLLFVPSLFGFWLFVKGVTQFITSYKTGNEAFTPKGFRPDGGRLIPYHRLDIILYRGGGEIDDTCSGVLEVRILGRQPIHIGFERENFFLLPYALREWAGDRLKVRPITKAPQTIQRLAYVTSVWFSPTFFRNATLRRQP
jgi:hypothetical protein